MLTQASARAGPVAQFAESPNLQGLEKPASHPGRPGTGAPPRGGPLPPEAASTDAAVRDAPVLDERAHCAARPSLWQGPVAAVGQRFRLPPGLLQQAPVGALPLCVCTDPGRAAEPHCFQAAAMALRGAAEASLLELTGTPWASLTIEQTDLVVLNLLIA